MKSGRKRAFIGVKEQENIAKYVHENRDMQRTKLAEKIQAEVKWSGKAPEIEVLERKISEYRRVPHLPQDEPWTLGILKDNPLPPEVLPVLLKIWLWTHEAGEDGINHLLTIREARWVAQLYGMTDNLHLLRKVAVRCADRELIGELAGTATLAEPEIMLSIYAELSGNTKQGWGMTKEQFIEYLRKYLVETQLSSPQKRKRIKSE